MKVDTLLIDCQIPVTIHQDDKGLFTAKSPLVRGLLAVSKDRYALVIEVRRAIRDLAVAAMNELNAPQESGSSRSAVSDGVDQKESS